MWHCNRCVRHYSHSNQGYGRIERFTADGIYLSGIGAHGNGEGQFSRPTGLSFGPDGNLYILDTGNNRNVIMKEEIVIDDVTSLDDKYARFSRSVDDWWNTTW